MDSLHFASISSMCCNILLLLSFGFIFIAEGVTMEQKTLSPLQSIERNTSISRHGSEGSTSPSNTIIFVIQVCFFVFALSEIYFVSPICSSIDF